MPRKSIFRFSLKSPKPPTTAESPSPHQQHNDSDEVSLPADPEARYIPRQWAPNRLQTLYVTPSEQNLYLAAMSQLDRAPPPLPLWTDPAPTLPAVPHQPAMDPTPPSVKSPPRKHVNLPMSPKLVTSPGMPIQGLSIREEFRSVPGISASRSSDHALLALSDESLLRFHGFPLDVLVAVEDTLKEAWPRGRRSASPNLEDWLKKPGDQRGGTTWIVVLKGNVWRQAGHSELDSIRLILALLTTLSVHGWTLVDRMQAAGVKYDNHNLLFAHSPKVAAKPPTYFALSIPLPDRISLISPPPKATPAIISTVREAIQSHSSKRKGKSNFGNGASGSGDGGTSIEWDAWKGNIRLEGWVHAGVYRFWLGGMRRWLGHGVKWRIVQKLHPSLILSLINSLSAQHFSLLTSLPLLPLVKGRDILIFASQPPSGLTFRDTWKSQPSASGTTTRSESPVLIQQEDAVPLIGERVPRELEDTVDPRERGAARQDAAGVMAAERRQAGLLSDDHTARSVAQVPPKRQRHASLDVPPRTRQPSPTRPANEERPVQPVRRRSSTVGSSNPLIPANTSTPRQRNLLVKKSSLRRSGSLTRHPSRSDSLRRNHQDQPHQTHNRSSSLDDCRQPEREDQPDQVHITSRHGIGSEVTEDGEWSFVNIPKETGLGLSMYAPRAGRDEEINQGVTTRNAAWNEVEAPMPPPLPARPLVAEHANPLPPPPLPPRPVQSDMPISVTQGSGFTTVPQPVITPLNPNVQPEMTWTQVSASRPAQAVRARQSFETERSVYVDADTPGHFHLDNAPPTSYGFPAASSTYRPDSATYDDHSRRDLMIANPTPPPGRLVHPGVPMPMPVQMPIQESLSVPLSQPASPMRGRDAMVDVGSGLGAISIRGSVGYMPSLASQSVLGLTPAPSEGPILGAWNEGKGGDVPMPVPASSGTRGHFASDTGASGSSGPHEVKDKKGKSREGVRNMFGFRSGKVGEGDKTVREQVNGHGSGVGNGVGSARTKVSMGS